MSKRIESTKFIKVCDTMKVWERLRPAPDKARLGDHIEVQLGKGKIAVYHLFAVDHEQDMYYLTYCRERRVADTILVRKENVWDRLQIKRWLLSVTALWRGSKG